MNKRELREKKLCPFCKINKMCIGSKRCRQCYGKNKSRKISKLPSIRRE